MDEVETQGIEQPVAQELANPQTEAAQETQQAQAVQVEDRNDRNWRELRRAKEEWERKAKMQEEILQRMLAQQAQNQSSNEIQPEEDIIHELAKEEYVPGEKVAKGLKKLKDEFRREIDEVKKSYASQHQNSLFNDLKREFPDFDDVVNSETLALLEETNPRLANTIAASKDPYSIAVQSYEYIKAKGISNRITPSKRAKETEMKIEQNKKSIQTPQALEKRPMAQAFQMTESMKKELSNEMYHYASQAGMGY